MVNFLFISTHVAFLYILTQPIEALKCHECGYGIRSDVAKFPNLFGAQNLSPSLAQAGQRDDKWCGWPSNNNNTSSQLVDCPDGCALFTVSDRLTYLAGCAVKVGDQMTFVHVTITERRNTEYQLIMCNEDGCNSSLERALRSKVQLQKPHPPEPTIIKEAKPSTDIPPSSSTSNRTINALIMTLLYLILT